MKNLMLDERVREEFEAWADQKFFDVDKEEYGSDEEANIYTDDDTRMAFEVWCSAIDSYINSK